MPASPLSVQASTTALLSTLGWTGASDPEGFSDAQRVPDPTNPNAFGPRVTVVPAPYLDTISLPAFMPAPVLVALVDLDGPLPGASTDNPLGLQAGTNCVYLQRVNPPRPWRVRVSTPGGAGCAPAGAELPVASSAGGNPNDYPGAARIEEHGVNGTTLIVGVRCGPQWCDLGTSAPIVPGHGHDVGNGLQSSIAGWHDEQRLALYSGGLSVSPFWAAIVPEPGIEQRPPAYYSTYRTVARVYIYGGDQTTLNASKYGVPASGKFFGMTVIDAVNSPEPNELQLMWDGTTWHAQLANGRGDPPHVLTVTPQFHPFARKPPGTARWVWRDVDDDM
jgi:hypothetical protein